MVRQATLAKSYDPVRSVRISNKTWGKAKHRALHEGHTMSHVMAMLVEGYSRGMISLPVMVMQIPQVTSVQGAKMRGGDPAA